MSDFRRFLLWEFEWDLVDVLDLEPISPLSGQISHIWWTIRPISGVITLEEFAYIIST